MRTKTVVTSALATVVVLGIVATASAQPAAKPKYDFEKCYGVIKAGKNDCQTANSSCAGTSKMDNNPTAWIYLPKGSCDRIVGASTQPKA